MGGFQLTNYGLQYPDPNALSIPALLSGAPPNPPTKWMKDKGKALDEANRELNAAGPPSLTIEPSTLASSEDGGNEPTSTPAGMPIKSGATLPPMGLVNAMTGKPSTAMPVAANTPASTPDASSSSTPLPPHLSFAGGAPTVDSPAGASGLPQIVHPSASEAITDPATSPRLTKLGAFTRLLLGAAQGGLAGLASTQITPRGAVSNPGRGFEAAIEQPESQALAQQQVQAGNIELGTKRTQAQFLPWQLAMNQRIAQLEAGKTVAQTNQANAEAGAATAKGNLDMADAITKPYVKSEDGRIYQAVRDANGQTTLQPVEGTGTLVTLPDEVLKQVGLSDHAGKNWQIPVRQAGEIQRIADEGNMITQANGRVVEINKQSGKVLKDYGAATPVVTLNQQMGPLASTPNVPTNARGEAALSSIPASVRGLVQDVGDYKIPLSSATQRVPLAARANFATYLNAYNPNFSEGNYEANNKTAVDYSPAGATGKQIVAFNTAIRHLGGAADAASKLNNTQSQDWNSLWNTIKQHVGNPDVTNFDTFKTYLTGELAKSLGGGVPTDASRAEAGGIMSRVQSPAQLQGAFKTAVGLMRGKISTLENAYEAQMGHRKTLVDPGAQQILNRLGLQNEGVDNPTPTANQWGSLGFVPLPH